MNKKGTKVLVAMSGGVDSTVAAHLLMKEGYDVSGLYMKVYRTIDDGAQADFLNVCETLGIPHEIVDVSDSFKTHVVDYFVETYRRGETPNPCVACNKHIKFGLLLDLARERGARYLATGHYAKIVERDGIFHINRAKSDAKDQTYMFYNMNQEILSHLLMPLGQIESKEQVREIARSLGLAIAEKSDSQEICFVPNDDYIAFLRTEGIEPVPGEFVDQQGQFLGKHRGTVHFTVGQRKGLGMSFGKPTYVVSIDAERQRVELGDNAALMSDSLEAEAVNVVSDPIDPDRRYEAKIRYSARPAGCRIEWLGKDRIRVRFEEPQRAATPGQSIVFYDGERLVGGAIIKK